MLTASYLPPSSTPSRNPLQLVLSLTRDPQGNVWAGTEADGVWRCDPFGRWTRFTTREGLSEDSGTALVCDLQGRLWVGHRRQGVSVFNGRVWKNYNALTGPLGGRVFALAVCPTDGDVWMATDRGLARWSSAADTWTYYTHAQGVPDDQAVALAFGRDGTLYEGTQASGLAVASPQDGYQSWRVTPGPAHTPNAPAGDGLPSPLINALLVSQGGTVYAGTTCGLAGSQDGGRTWRYLRGQDWRAKAQQQASGAPSALPPVKQELLSEDYVTSLAEDATGSLWVGHRHTGTELFDPRTGRHVSLPRLPFFDFVRALIVPDGAAPWVADYGVGLFAPGPATVEAGELPVPPLPSPASAPDADALTAQTQQVSARMTSATGSEGAFLGDDWATQGDWVGRYGQQYAILYGTESPSDQVYAPDSRYSLSIEIGPHHTSDYGGVYTYVSRLYTDDPRILYDPARKTRRDSEVNDGSWQFNKYPLTWEGPDLWLTVQTPPGLHRISLYFVNDDGHFVNDDGIGDNRLRDYTLELRSGTAASPGPVLAHTRVFDFYDGVYKQFLVQGPGPFCFRVGRNNSFVTKLQGVFMDRVTETPAAQTSDTSPTLAAAQALWAALDAADEAGAAPDTADRVLAYRAAASAGAPASLLTDWRENLHFWTAQDRADFDQAMIRKTMPR